jgi:hypothetical protein
MAGAVPYPRVIAAAPPPLVVHHGTVRMDIDVRFGLRLVQLGVDAYPVAPATQNSLVFTLPVKGGRVKRHTASLESRGGFDMQNKETRAGLKVEDIAFRVKRRRVSLSGFATAQGVPATRFAFARGTVGSARRTRRGYTAKRVVIAINGVAAASLNSQLRTQEFHAGQRFAVATLKARG